MLRRFGALALGLGVGLGLGAGTPASANPASLVASAADPGDPADLHLHLDYEYSIETATLWRESVGEDIDPLAPLPKHEDLSFKQYRHRITPRADLGIFRNTSLYAALPIVIAQQRRLDLAVSRETSSTLRDGFLPPGGFDARAGGGELAGDAVFRDVTRKGLDQVHLGAAVALMNQDKDATKPTWKLGAEARLAVGKIMTFDAMNPDAQTGVGRGVHEVRVWTSMARRYRRAEAWFELYWQAPVAEKSSSLFHVPAAEKFGATNTRPGQRGGTAFGVELFAVDDTQNRISLDLGARVDAHFEGRGYSEMWEVFALAGDVRLGGPLRLDADPTTAELDARSHPGITNIENHLETAGRAAVRAQLGKYVRFAATFDLVWKTDHVITFADAGIDLPTCGAPGVRGACETDDNSVVSQESEEVNPLHAQRIDLVGHRYHSEDNFGFVIGVQGQILF